MQVRPYCSVTPVLKSRQGPQHSCNKGSLACTVMGWQEAGSHARTHAMSHLTLYACFMQLVSELSISPAGLS